jgi:hypothetical protein
MRQILSSITRPNVSNYMTTDSIPGYMDFGQGVFLLSLLAEPYFNMQ